MNSLIETLNLWGGRIPNFAWPMLWQSSLLITVLFVFDLAARRKVRASVRYALWLVLLVKLLLPPTLALPTSVAWWVRPPATSPKPEARATAFVVTYGDFVPAGFSTPAPLVVGPPPKPSLSSGGWAAAMWAVVGAGLLAWLCARWRKVSSDVRRATVVPESLAEALTEAQHCITLPRHVRLLVTKRAMSPAVCGLFRPVILLPQSLVERLTPAQLRAVLLHELVHLRRGDVWVNCLQALLQILYWWHPLLWLANARIRYVREEAVDDSVMLSLGDDAETYAPTLLEVAKLALNRPLASLGLVGIMESRSALRQRIERLVGFHPPRKAGLTIASAFCILAFAALAVPMEQAPPTSATQDSTQKQTDEEVKLRMIVLNKPVAGDASQIRKLAAGIIAKVKGGAAFSDMASVFSEDQQRRQGSDWGWVQRYDTSGALVLRKELADAAFSLKPGEVSGVIETPEAIYLMLVEARRPAHIKALSAQDPKPLPQAHEQLRSDRDRKIEAIKQATPPSPNSRTTTNRVFTGIRQSIVSKLDRLRVGSVFFDDVPLGEVVLWLKDEARKGDPENRGINFMLDPKLATPKVDPTSGLPVGALEPLEIKTLPITINPPLTDVRLADVLEAIVRAAGNRVEYSIEDYAVVFSSKSAELGPLHTRTLKFDPEVFLPNLRQRMQLPDKSTDGEAIEALPKYLADAGLDLQPPCSCSLKERGLTLFRAPQEKLEAIERLFTELNNGRPQSEIPAPWRPPDRETIIRKLDQIRIDSAAYNETPLIEVIRNLSWETKHQDPEWKGLSFHIKYSAKLGKMVDLSAVKVTVPAISNARLSDLLDAIIKGADKPIKYFIWAGVAFYSTEDEPSFPLGMTLEKALPPVNATEPTVAFGPSTGRMTNRVQVLAEIPAAATSGSFGALPKSLYENTPGPRYVFSGKYFQVELREDGSYWAGGKQMNMEELRAWFLKTKQSDSNSSIGFQVHSNAPPKALQALTELGKELGMPAGSASSLPGLPSPEQLQIRTFKIDPDIFYKGLESVSPPHATRTNVSVAAVTFFRSRGVDLASPSAIALGKAVFWSAGKGTLLIRATKLDLDLIEAAIVVLTRVPPQINIQAHFVEIDQAETPALGWDWFVGDILLSKGAVTNSVNILTGPQFRVVLRALEQRKGADVLAAPSVTTVSGRQAQIQVVEMRTVVTGINSQAQLSTNGSTNSLYQTQTLPFGPVLDVVPYLAANGYTINMTVIPTITEFLGYDDPAIYGPTNSTAGPDKTVLPLPRFRVRQMTVTANVRDGQTLVLVGAVTTEVLKKPDGSTETKDVSRAQKKQLIVFVTPTLIDEAGNRLHTDDPSSPKPK